MTASDTILKHLCARGQKLVRCSRREYVCSRVVPALIEEETAEQRGWSEASYSCSSALFKNGKIKRLEQQHRLLLLLTEGDMTRRGENLTAHTFWNFLNLAAGLQERRHCIVDGAMGFNGRRGFFLHFRCFNAHGGHLTYKQ